MHSTTPSYRSLASPAWVASNFLLLIFIQAQVVTAQQTGMTITAISDAGPWKIMRGNTLIASYVADNHGKPIIFPIHSQRGLAMTRQYPMEAALPTEKQDHPHHRSLWFGYGEVNGYDFWADESNQGDIVQTSFKSEVANEGGVDITTTNDWISPTGQRVLSDVRRVAFIDDTSRNVIDFSVTLNASDGDLHFGDTKEGMFAMRVPGTMKVDAKLGGKIINSEGDSDAEAWGKRATWVDYSGPVGDETAGITMYDHPSNFNYPCRWHVRTYGLFAANPFGESNFTGGEKSEDFVLVAGDTLTLRYRVIIHDGPFELSIAEAEAKAFAK